MDHPLRTPLLDLFRRGEAPPDVRLLAARGALAPRPQEQLALLVLLLDDPDEAIRRAASETIERIPRDALASFLGRPDAGAELRAFFAARGVEPAETPSEGDPQPLIADAAAADEPGTTDQQGAAKRLVSMTVTERMKAAMRGTREERSLLIRDPNRLVAAAVLSSPKLTESEIEAFAKMANVSEEVLRIIGNTRAWVRKYPIAAGLAHNPKTPVAISLTLLPHLNEHDVKMIGLDRNMPEPVRIAARKLMASAASRRQ
jgi:hypothetical protein